MASNSVQVTFTGDASGLVNAAGVAQKSVAAFTEAASGVGALDMVTGFADTAIEIMNLGAAADRQRSAFDNLAGSQAIEFINALGEASQGSSSQMDAMAASSQALWLGVGDTAAEMEHLTEAQLSLASAYQAGTIGGEAALALSAQLANNNQMALEKVEALTFATQLSASMGGQAAGAASEAMAKMEGLTGVVAALPDGEFDITTNEEEIKGQLDSIQAKINAITGKSVTIQVNYSTSGGPPGFAHGVQNFSGGLAVVGEQGPELVALPRGSGVTPAPQTRTLLAGGGASGGGGDVSLSIFGDELEQMIVRRVAEAFQQAGIIEETVQLG